MPLDAELRENDFADEANFEDPKKSIVNEKKKNSKSKAKAGATKKGDASKPTLMNKRSERTLAKELHEGHHCSRDHCNKDGSEEDSGFARQKCMVTKPLVRRCGGDVVLTYYSTGK